MLSSNSNSNRVQQLAKRFDVLVRIEAKQKANPNGSLSYSLPLYYQLSSSSSMNDVATAEKHLREEENEDGAATKKQKLDEEGS